MESGQAHQNVANVQPVQSNPTSPTSTKSRRFAAEPVETTTKTSRKFAPQPVETTQKSTRKFAVEPVETTSKSSRKQVIAEEAPTQDTATSPKATRRFAPEPLETSTKSSRKAVPESLETTAKSTRRFAPEPVESSTKSSRKFVPEPMETTTKSSRNVASIDGTAAKKEAPFSSPFWKKVQQNLNQDATPIGTKTSVEEARQLEQNTFWEKVEKSMDTNNSAAAEETPAPSGSFKPLSFWDKVQKNMDAPVAPVKPAEQSSTTFTPGSFWSKVSKNMDAPTAPVEVTEKPTASFTPGSFWSKVSKNMDPPAAPEPVEKPASFIPGSFWSKVSKNMDNASMDSGVGDVASKSAAPFTPLSFWDKVSKNLDGGSSPDSGVGDMSSGSQTPPKASFVPLSFWDKVQRNMGDTEDRRGRPTTQSSKSAPRKFTPQVISTSRRSYRKSWMDEEDEDIPLLPHERVVQPASFSSSPGSSPARRRFAPQLLETATRTHKAGEKPAVPPRDKTNASSGSGSTRGTMTPENAPSAIPSHIAELLNKSNQGPQRKRYPSRRNTRGHSFKIPELESIDSSESEEETTGPPSLSHSHSDLSEVSEQHFKHATRIRESVDDRFSGYLLELAARAAEKQLREQAEAAFPNSEFHEPVTHYMDCDSGGSDEEVAVQSPKLSRTQSMMHNHKRNVLTRNHRQRNDSDEEKIALQELQQHAERMSEAKKGGGRNDGQDPWMGQDALKKAQAVLQLNKQRDAEARQMRKAASPPMLGGDIEFPRCTSPDNARFDVTQGSDFLRNSMCALTQQANEKGGLWGPSKPAERESSTKKTGPTAGISSRAASRQASGTAGNANGLWGGLCTTMDQKLSPMPTGLVTPMYTPAKEKEDPFNAFSVTSTSSTGVAGTAGRRQPAKRVPPSPKPSMQLMELARANEKLELEAKVDAEFTDEFVTQVYNYLSLGYPSVARKFDDELSRISRVDVSELRQDDKLTEAKGYVRLGEDEVTARETGVDESMCARWRALRLYVREWGRQQKSFAGPEPLDPHRAWGLTARRGSWGL